MLQFIPTPPVPPPVKRPCGVYTCGGAAKPVLLAVAQLGGTRGWRCCYHSPAFFRVLLILALVPSVARFLN
jgi:hypothetical protein